MLLSNSPLLCCHTVLKASGIRMIVTDDLDDAANKAVHVAEIVKQAEDVALNVQFGLGDSFVPM